MSESISATLTTAYVAWFEAIVADGVGPISEMLDDEWIYTNYDGLVRHKAEYLEWVDEFSDPVTFVGPYELTVSVHGEIALVLGGYRVLGPGDDDVLELRFSGAWRNDNGAWRCLMHHNSEVSHG